MKLKKRSTLFLLLSVLTMYSQQWKQNFKIVEPTRVRDNSFGFSVATYDGFAAYASSTADVQGVESAGKVYIARQDCDGWTIYQELTRPDARNYCGFGSRLFMEGKTLVVSGCDSAVSNGNAIYIYERDNSDQYVFKQKIGRVENSLNDNYSSEFAISENFMVVGAYYNSTDSNLSNYLENAGAAYIFAKGTDGVWTLVQKIVASDRERRDTFGNSVAIYKNTIVVGAVKEGTNWAGAAYVFEKDNNSNTWRETKKLTAYDFRGLQDRFGEIVQINENGIMISAPAEDDYDSNLSGDGGGALTFTGSVYIFKKGLNGEWNGHQKIRASDSSINISSFGGQMEIYKDQLAIRSSESEYDSNGNLSKIYGRVYMFKKGVNDLWTEYQIVQSNIKRNSDWFAGSISLYDKDLFIGAFWDGLDANDQNYIGYTGSVYIFNPYDYLNAQKPVLNRIPVLKSCADLGNGFSSSFNMATIENDLVENPNNFLFTYSDQSGNKLPSPLPVNYSNSTPFSEKINVRVANKNNLGCYKDTKIELETFSSFTLNQVPDIYKCDLKGTGFAEFDLSKINSILVNDPSLFTFSYFDKNGNDISGFIDESYTNTTKNREEINIIVTDITTLCNVKAKINLHVSNDGSDCKEDDYIVPKFFTPNADGFNDVWEITGVKNQNYKIYIYDRYGKLLKTLEKEESWDGNYNGVSMPSSDYWFQLVFENGLTKKGHFALKK
ncbi:T9SS type B sorting domain-containing protein [Flavobacterium sp. N502536]|uniref:T9SS type B sorting domain-containing protein n=1 Tax=Flavobacterium sp. N502536 TaxID=2986837 RepID=UPI002222D8D3|nr:T9SS type B sorting domain-containing protein [Flavobacterium sp. N502536]